MPYKNPEDRAKARKRYYEKVRQDPIRWAHRKRVTAEGLRRLKERDPRRPLFMSAKERAVKFDLPFLISLEDIIIPPLCPVLGSPLKIAKGYAQPNSPSLDRIKPELGYVPGNIIVMSHRANRIKGDASLQELEQVISFLKEYP